MSENTVMDITQDNEGLIWIATWNGLNRFDGVNFKVYKARQSNSEEWSSNRIEHLKTDIYGNVWCVTYDNRAFRFVQRREVFEEMPAPSDGKPVIPVNTITALPNGTVWLLSDTEGAIRVTYDTTTQETSSAVYLSNEAGCDRGAHVYSVLLDSRGGEWLVTSNGLLRIDSDTAEETVYLDRTETQTASSGKGCHLFTASEMGGNIFFGGTDGTVWIYSFDTDKFEKFKIDSRGDVIAIKMLQDSKVCAITNKGDIFIHDTKADSKKLYKLDGKFDFNRHPAASVYIDSHDEIWFGVEKHGTVCHFNPRTETFKTEQMSVEIEPAERSAPYFSTTEDAHGNLWIHPMGGGLSWFDRDANRLVPFHNEKGSPDWLFSNKLHSMMTDRQGNLWLGTHSKGLEKVTFYENEFSLFIPSPLDSDLQSASTTDANHVRTVFEDNKHRLWIGTRDGRISVYGNDWQLLGYLSTDGLISKTAKPFIGVIYKIMQDSKGELWIATKGHGLLRLEEGNDGKFSIRHLTNEPSDSYSLSSNVVYDVAEDGKGRIWAVTFDNGINIIDTDGNRIINSNNLLKTYPLERCGKARRMVRGSDGTLWVATSNGLLSFNEDFSDPAQISFNLHFQTANDDNSLGGNNVYDILLSSQGELYFASFDGGLSVFKGMSDDGKARFRSFSTHDGLPTDVLYSLAEDSQGNIWIGTEYGLSCMNPSSLRFDNFVHEIGEGIDLEESTATRFSDGRMMFGTNSGVLSFFPEQITPNNYVPDIIFSELRINGDVIAPGTHEVLPMSLNGIDKLILTHKENTVTISFAALDFTAPGSIRYAYKLEGFDQGWNYIGNQQSATYTNLPHGEYTFMVSSTNGAGVWLSNVRSLRVKVKPSFNETPGAIILYSILALALLAVIAYIFFTIFRLKHEVSVEQQISELKLSFFTNISHELRTPLTLIAGPVEHILTHCQLNDDVRNQLQVVERNTNRMLHLVNQILDFRKMKSGKMKLRVEQVDVVAFLKKMMLNFETIAKENGINFIFESNQAELKLWADVDKLEKIVFNLLSNAFKYVPKGKNIRLFIHDNGDTVSLGVDDDGPGIPKSKQSSIFAKFETAIEGNISTINSTGIGLAFVKELVDIHHAQISLDSDEGKGSCFTVTFKKDKDTYKADADFIIDDNIIDSETADTANAPDNGNAEMEPASTNQKTMLIVEDNTELRSFLHTVFAPKYSIIEAADGVEGLEKAVSVVPDIIVTDVSMPRKDGIELISDLRGNLTTSHIPIVLLTAKTDNDTKLRGIQLGAESYITKPFSASYLEARVDNLLLRRESLQRFYCDKLMERVEAPAAEPQHSETAKTSAELEKTMSTQDRKFMQRLTELMEKNIDNSDLVVDDLAKELAISRSVFFKKLKSLTGLAPVEFIREIRITRAAQLIETTKHTMTQIAFMVGINDPRYFSRCFKQRYGMTPTEYKSKFEN